jgi:hypothetical protein
VTEGIRLYLDEDTINRALIAGLRARNVDVLTAREAGKIGTSDETQLTFSTASQRTIFTFNTRDFVQLHSEWLEKGQEHSGIVVSDQLQVGVVLRRLLKFLDTRSSEEMRNWLEFLSNWR